jgi:predicted AAA+ superfamily ATPase
MLIGGMPSVVREYIRSKSIPKCQSVQAAILQTYRDDFGKYANLAKHKYLQKVFDAVPRMTGQKFKYSRVDDQAQSREIKDALDLLERAGVVHRICRTAANRGPVSFLADDRHFKVLFLDVGLMQYACGLTQEIAVAGDLLDVYRGAVAEAFVGQELLACQDRFKKNELHYWAREQKNSNAEVDYIMQ